MATLSQLQATLDSAGEVYHLLPLQDNFAALLTRRGARVLGLFAAPDTGNLFWTNDALTDADRFRAFAAAGEWNLGGERCWIAPEIQYNIHDRTDFFGTHRLPPAIDPGAYTLDTVGDAVVFRQQITLTAYNTASGTKTLDIVRVVRPAQNPLRALRRAADLMRGLRYAGYEQTATLAELNAAPILSEMWNLVQVNAGGQLIIPCTPGVEASDYFGSVPDEARAVRGSHLRLHITGARQYKVGYKAAGLTGRLAYWHALPDGREYLLVKQFFNNPSGVYAEEPPDAPGETGHSVHVYNDGGQLGGDRSFGEMECSGQAIGGRAGRSASTDTFILWAYVGAPEAIRRAAEVLLGVAL